MPVPAALNAPEPLEALPVIAEERIAIVDAPPYVALGKPAANS